MKEKLKIAVVTKQMVIGGTEKALLSMLKQFDFQAYELDLYLQELGGELFEEVPGWVNIIKMPTYSDISKAMALHHPFRFIDGVVKRFGMNENEPFYMQCERSCHCMPLVEKQYDVAIAYHAPDAVPFFYVIHNLRANHKIMWLHFDIEQTNAVNSLAEDYFSKYDKIFAVSEQSKAAFDRNYPEQASKSEVFYNLVDVEEIYRKAAIAPSFSDNFSGIRILSLGRLVEQKGYDCFLPVVKRLLNEGYSIKFYICGDGESRTSLERQRFELGLDNDVVFLGMQLNPYGFLRDCDIYVQPSRNEGFCTTSNEARMFKKPVVVTNVCGMREQFEDHVTGTIVPRTEEDLYLGVKELLDNRELCIRYSDNLSKLVLNQKIDLERILR